MQLLPTREKRRREQGTSGTAAGARQKNVYDYSPPEVLNRTQEETRGNDTRGMPRKFVLIEHEFVTHHINPLKACEVIMSIKQNENVLNANTNRNQKNISHVIWAFTVTPRRQQRHYYPPVTLRRVVNK
eukprot:7795124-Pyramimonas_sp.AAC.1